MEQVFGQIEREDEGVVAPCDFSQLRKPVAKMEDSSPWDSLASSPWPASSMGRLWMVYSVVQLCIHPFLQKYTDCIYWLLLLKCRCARVCNEHWGRHILSPFCRSESWHPKKPGDFLISCGSLKGQAQSSDLGFLLPKAQALKTHT